MQINKKIQLPKMHNYFSVKVIDTVTNEVVQEAKGYNVVLDQFYHRMFATTTRVKGARGIRIGSGSGTPSKSDTDVFTNITQKDWETTPQITITEDLVTLTGYIKLLESEQVGVTIRELGLIFGGTSTSNFASTILMTHAMLQDSEGNPISIAKTNTQIIEIYATLYIERGVGVEKFTSEHPIIKWITSQTGNMASIWSVTTLRVFLPNPQMGNGAYFSLSSYDKNTKTAIFTASMPTTSTNNSYIPEYPTCDILGFKFPQLEEGFFFPNSSAFSAFTFSERTIGVGDGNNKFFNLSNGYFIDDSISVKVDGVTKTKGVDYITRQGARQVLNRQDCEYPYNSKLEPLLYSTDSNKENEQFIKVLNSEDNETIKFTQYSLIDLQKVTRIGSLLPINMYNYAQSITMYYSVDKVNWTQFYQYSKPANNYFPLVTGLSGIDMRWISATISSTTLYAIKFFGHPSIEFINPPANGSAVTASWQTEIPPKNANFFYNIQASITASW